MSNLNALTQALLKLDDHLSSCMRCGNCQAVCPVFTQTIKEADVARGKIVLLQNLAHELIRDPQAVEDRLNRCLLCGSCQTNCASGVKTLEIFIEGRNILTQYKKLSPLKKFIFRSLLPRPKLFASMLRTGSIFQGLILRKQKNIQNTATAPLLTSILGARQMPALARMQLHKKYGNLEKQNTKINVIFYPGCMTDKIYTQIGDAVLEVLRHYDVGVIMPTDFSCCGMPALASGDHTSFQKLLQNNIDVFNRIDPDNSINYIVSACPSCTETIHNWWVHYGHNLNIKDKAKLQKMSVKTMDIHKFLHDIIGIEAKQENNIEDKNVEINKQIKLTYHDSCHLKKSLNVSIEPRELLKQNLAYKLIEMPEADICCGCGGSFTITQQDLSKQIGTKKRNNIIASQAECVATGCPACMMQISDMLARNGDNIAVKHSIEIIAEGLK